MDRRKAWKSFLLGNAHKLGILELGRVMRRNKMPILCYHRFTSSGRTNGAISAELFDAHLRYLKKHFTVISPAEMLSLLEGTLRVRNPLVLTVDDGYRDFVDVAFPLLEKHGIPATLFVTTRFIDGEIWLWPDVVKYIVMKADNLKLELPDSESDFPLGAPEEKREALSKLLIACKRLKEEEKGDFLKELGDRMNVRIPPVPPPEFQPATWEELRRFDKSFVGIGSHTLTHPLLSRTSLENAEAEIIESRRRIERMLGCEVTAFAYPNGMQGDYMDQHKEILKKHGYRFAVTCNSGFNTFDSDLFELDRIVAQHDMPHFVQQISGFENLKQQALDLLSFGWYSSDRMREGVTT